MPGQENFQANDSVSVNNNAVESGAKCYADAYSGVKCGGRAATTSEVESGSTVTQRMNETATNSDTTTIRSADGTQPINNDVTRTQTPSGRPSLGQNERMNKPSHGEIEKLPYGQVPEGFLKKLHKEQLPKGLESKSMPGKLPSGGKDAKTMEGQLDNFDTLTGKDKLKKGEGGGGGFKDGEGFGGGGGTFGKDFDKPGGDGKKGSLGPVDKNGDGTIDGVEKQFDKNGNDVLDEHEQMQDLANEAKRAAKAGGEAAGGSSTEEMKKQLKDLGKKLEEFDKGGCPEFEDEGESMQQHQVYPPNDPRHGSLRGAMGTLPSIGEIAPDINSWSRAERGGSAGRGAYDETPAQQRHLRRQYQQN